MADTYYTIGMAGHIDHGKTALTKALTQVDTDRLKEERERGISIEAGYAPLETADGTHVSIIDVPGHERFIRQMIAGVAGIDLVVLVVAADEGVMPQTEEHLDILQFLGVSRCIMAVTKIDRVDDEMLELVTEDIQDRLAGTIFDGAPYVFTDSISGEGVEDLRQEIFRQLKDVKFRDSFGSFRLPIDQVFSVQGQGTVVRGTVYEGAVAKGSQLTVLPSGVPVKARQIQVHHQEQPDARAGQRAAINLGGADRETVRRGDVLVASDHFLVTDTIDVSLKTIREPFTPLKQRAPVKVHVGTSEVMGKIVLFDRNELEQGEEEVLCQIRLDEPVVVRRGDRFVLRRPTPVETLAGGWVIEPNGGKYRFGEETIRLLAGKREGTPEDLIRAALDKQPVLSLKELIQQTSLSEPAAAKAAEEGLGAGWLTAPSSGKFVLTRTLKEAAGAIEEMAAETHTRSPMRPGVPKAELLQTVSSRFPKPVTEAALNELMGQGKVRQNGQYVALADFEPHMPEKWKTRMGHVLSRLERDGIEVGKWSDYADEEGLPEQLAAEFAGFLTETGQAFRLTPELIVHRSAYEQALSDLQAGTEETFALKEAKDALGLSRKYLIPFLELLDQQKVTIRQGEERKWASGRKG
ncbi:selenocysteine-specific translation elongation factor [Indiicoccus explosivorum]|uniref:selenocysteine-specific translation elongation factor n=1 Tax=Indiicoccus explosivorum TaxID=1917864 RepID=UPI000B44080A|nr:selenocysteine-specific translation elongation factor [Indiicoccus explosivorum]